MSQGNSREIILKRIKDALNDVKVVPAVSESKKEVFAKPSEQELSVVFAENLIKNMGEFIYMENVDEFISTFQAMKFKKNIRNIYSFEPEIVRIFKEKGVAVHSGEKDFLDECEAAVTTCEALIARTGSIFISSATESGRRLSVYPPIHIVLAYTSQIKYDIGDGITYLKEKYKGNIPSMISLVTGPSRTADIEKTLVLGAHGPKELIVFLIDDTSEY